MEQYLSSLSQEQKKLLSLVENGTLQNVSVALAQSSLLMNDPVYSYITLVKALHRRHKSLSTLLIDKCSVVTTFKTKQYCTPLIYAIQLGDLKIFDLLHTRGASLFDRDANDMNALELLVENQEHGLFVDFILARYRNNNNLDPESTEDQMIFHLACFKGDIEMMEKFIRCNFSINSHSNFRTKKWAGATPLQFALRDSVYGDPSRAVSLLLKLDVDLNTQDKHGNTPLHSAIKLIYIQDQDTEEKFVDKVFKAYIRRFNPKKACNLSNRDGISIFHLLCSLNWEKEYENYSTKLLKIIKFFLNENINVNSSNRLKSGHDYAGYTALHFATCANSLKIVKLLLKYGADPSKCDAKGNTALHRLDYRDTNCSEILELLLKHGASIDAKNLENETPIHCAFYWQKRNKSLMNLIFNASREVCNHTNSEGLSLLHIASTLDLRKVKIFVENGALVKARVTSGVGGFYGYSALHFAVMFNKVDIVEYLLAHGAEVNPPMINQDGEIRDETTPLHLACSEQLKYFYGAPDEYNDLFAPPNKIIKLSELVEENEDFDWALTRNKQIRIVELLLKHGASVNTKNSMKLCPLIVAIQTPSNWNPYDHDEQFQMSVLNEICIRQTVIVDLLLNYGANVDAQEHCKESLLHLLLKQSHQSPLVKILAENILRKGANVDALDCRGYSPLHIAVQESTYRINEKVYHRIDTSFIDLFLTYGANVNTRSENEDAPLHTAVKNYHSDADRKKIFVKLLEQPRININARNNVGDTPLHLAVREQHSFCVKILLNAGANINIENNDGLSPICIIYKAMKVPPGHSGTNFVLLFETVMIHVKNLMALGHFVSKKVTTSYQSLMKYQPIETQ